MKKIASILFVALFTLSTFAQREQRKQKHYEFTAEQIAEIQTKKMTLHLDLTKNQQEQILEINKKNAIERQQKMEERKALKETQKEPSSDEIFAKKSARLDKMIAHKTAMKEILNDEQYATWEKSKTQRMRKMKKSIAKKKMHQRKMRR